jgi:hypothetical protein
LIRTQWCANNQRRRLNTCKCTELDYKQQGMVRTIAIGYEGKGPTVC